MARPNFIELPARDLAASQAFFETVFGMTMTAFGPTYACTLTGDVDIGLQADQQEVTKAPLPVIEVQDLEATLAAVAAHAIARRALAGALALETLLLVGFAATFAAGNPFEGPQTTTPAGWTSAVALCGSGDAAADRATSAVTDTGRPNEAATSPATPAISSARVRVTQSAGNIFGWPLRIRAITAPTLRCCRATSAPSCRRLAVISRPSRCCGRRWRPAKVALDPIISTSDASSACWRGC